MKRLVALKNDEIIQRGDKYGYNGVMYPVYDGWAGEKAGVIMYANANIGLKIYRPTAIYKPKSKPLPLP